VRLAYDNRHVCCLSITKKEIMAVSLIDSFSQQMIGRATLGYSLPYKI